VNNLAPGAARLVSILLASSLMTGCITFTGPVSALRPTPRDSTTTWRICDEPSPCVAKVSFTYLGVAGFLIQAGDETIMTAPSFSHPSLAAAATPFWRIHSDSAVVDRELHRLLGPELAPLANVSTILVGHSHYDHLMDVPLIARRYLPRATIHGTLSTKRILMGDPSLRATPSRIDSLSPADTVIGTAWHVGRWIYSPGRRMRFMALKSSHAPNWWFITIAPCHTKHDRSSLPRTAWGWCVGEPVSYVIDVLDEPGGRPVFRIFYQDAATRPLDVVLPPFSGIDARPIDVAIVCAGNFKKVPEYPTLLLAALRPKYVILGHWEDFFHDPARRATPVRFTDTKELASRLDQLSPHRWVTLLAGGKVTALY
jgi:glyoxylase-like metal-dependent hydrolase (beta-lactamase superfamily II)